jgi:integrase
VRLFSTPLHQAYALPKGYNAAGDAAYWIPVMGAYTGARVTELAQLLCADITEEPEGWFLHFRITYPSWQSLKAPASRRKIPIHAEMIRLGLLDYLKAIGEAGHERLFPEAKWSELNHAGGNVANWFSKFKRDLGFGPSNTFHGWRNSVETRLQRKRETQIIIDKYVGHKPEGSEGVRYARLTHLDLLDVPGKIEYAGLSLPSRESVDPRPLVSLHSQAQQGPV